MKRKVWEVQVKDNSNQIVLGENDDFYTTDTEAFLVFELADENFSPTAATLTLENRRNNMLDRTKVPVKNGLIEWEMTEKYIGHSGTWYVQLEYELMKGSVLEKYTSAPMIFNVNPHLADRDKPSVTKVDNWRTFMEEASGVIERVQARINTGEFDGTITFEELTSGQIEMLRGHEGKNLEYNWDGTRLGIRVEGQSTYHYVDLKGPKGDKGDPSTWASLAGKPTTFKPKAHTHKISEVTGLSDELGDTAVVRDLKNDVANLKSQKGSNKYGHWIKRADGTMTTWSTFELGGEPNGKWGELYYWQPTPISITFPQTFIETPTVQYANADKQFLWSQSTSRAGAKSISGYRGVKNTIKPVTITLKATGRWSEAVDGNFFKGRDLPNYWRSHLTNKVKTIQHQEAKNKDNFSFSFITDMHMDSNNGRSFSLMHALLEDIDLENIMMGGDFVRNPAVTPKVDVLRQIQEVIVGFGPYWERLLTVVGNHDDNTVSGRWSETLQGTELYNAILKHMGGEVTFGPGKTYYYKDDTINKVRYLVLNSSNVPRVKDGTGVKYNSIRLHLYQQEQITWVADVGLNVPDDDWSVIVTSHAPPYEQGMVGYDFPTLNETLMRGVIGAFNNKTTYSGASPSNVPSEFKASVTADFTGGGGQVLAWFCGHVHYDNMVQMPEGITLISTLNDGGTRWSNSPRNTLGTTNEQAFDVVTVDKNARKLYLTRIGAGADRVVSY